MSHDATGRIVCGNCGRPWDGFANDCLGHMTDGRAHAVLPPRPDEVGPRLCQNPWPITVRNLEIDTALRQTFDWWSQAELRAIDPNDDLEQFLAMFWSIMQDAYLGEEASQ